MQLIQRIKTTCWLFLAIPCLAEETPPLPTLSIGHWPPYIDQSSPSEGILSRIVLDVYHEAGIEPRVTFDSWANVFQDHLKKPHHLSYGWVKNSERAKNWYYSDPIAETGVGLWVRTEFNQPITDYAHLKPYLIGVGRNTSYGQAFEDNKHTFRRAEFAQEGQGFGMLIAGRIDAFIGDRNIGEYYLSRHKNWQSKVYFLETPIFPAAPMYMVCEKKNLDCLPHLKRFNQALKQYQRQLTATDN